MALAALLVALMTQKTEAAIVGIQWVGWTPYYVDVVANGPNATVWYRMLPWPTRTDVPVVTLHASTMTLGQAAKLVCGAKQVYDGGREILGCGSVIASGVCAVGAVPSAGSDAIVCSTVWGYTASTGFADCVSGISGVIANYLNTSAGWSAYSTWAEVNQGTWTGVISGSIDMACQDAQNNN